MSKVNHDHLFIVAAAMLFIAAFVFTLGVSGAIDMPTGMATTQVTWISCIDSEIPPTPYIAGTINVTYKNLSSLEDVNVLLTDECNGGKSVLEYACKGNVPTKYTTNCPGGKVCSNGVCAVSFSQGCIDTDGGLNYMVKGIASAMNPISGQQILKIDACVMNENGYTEELDEAYCQNGVPTINRIPCAGGCDGQNGRCLNDVCTETDNGFDIYNYGVTTGVSIGGLGNQIEEDYCFNATHINEFWCSEVNPMYWHGGQFECPQGCNFETNECIKGDTQDEVENKEIASTSQNAQTNEFIIIDETRQTDSEIATPTLTTTTTTTTSGMAYAPNPINPVALCTDTDGGINKYIFGTAYNPNGSVAYNDSCYDTYVVREAYCDSLGPVTGLYSCGAGYICAQGRCQVQKTTNTTNTTNTTKTTTTTTSPTLVKTETTTTQVATGTPTSNQIATIGLTCACDMGTICPWSTCDKADASCECCIGTCPGTGCDLSGSGRCQSSVVYIS